MNKKDFLLFLKQNSVVLIIFTIIFITGLLTFQHYGESWDEYSMKFYADESVRAYTTWLNEGKVEFNDPILRYYGPFFIMTVKIFSEFLHLFLGINLIDGSHLIYFLAYFIGIISFYFLAKRWLSNTSALGTTLLFSTQPLFWGHAFINPKDTPFMALFLLSIASGLTMADKAQSEISKTQLLFSRRLFFIHIAWLISILILFVFNEEIYTAVRDWITTTNPSTKAIIFSIISKLNLAPDNVNGKQYLLLFLSFRRIYFIFSCLILLFLWKKLQPNLLRILSICILPAALLGITTSTRILGPLAGIIIVSYMIYKNGKKAFQSIVIYMAVAIIITYLTWPYLWSNPVVNFVESMHQMSAHPWPGRVLFNGELYLAKDIPYIYLPVLFVLQMTEPIWVLVIIGIGLSLYNIKIRLELIILLGFWFLLPVLAFIIIKPILYDNFRQILFILPPIFLMTGVVFEQIINRKWQIILITLCLLPSIASIFSLHPYEYIYYNRFVGNTEDLHLRFETDYWLTSYREAAQYLNEVAPFGATVLSQGPGQVFDSFTRNDLLVTTWSSSETDGPYDYIVVGARFIISDPQEDLKNVYQIKRGNILLALIKKP